MAQARTRPLPRISRFIVMAILQAARAQHLGLSQDSAYSWGLNRAIFYAAAKRGFVRGRSAGGERGEGPTEPSRNQYMLGREAAYRDPTSSKLYFTIGEETQTEKEFQRQVISRFGTGPGFRTAWEEAEAWIRSFDRETLESQRDFYEKVYKPRRDELAVKWSQLGAAADSS